MQDIDISADAGKRHILIDAMLDDLIREAFRAHPELRDHVDQKLVEICSFMRREV